MRKLTGRSVLAAALLSLIGLVPTSAHGAQPTITMYGRVSVTTNRAGTTVYRLDFPRGGWQKLVLPAVPPNTHAQRVAARNALRAANGLPTFLTGHRQKDGDFAVFSAAAIPDPPDGPPIAVQYRRVAIVPVMWSGAGARGIQSMSTYQSWAFNDAGSLANYWRANSNNVFQLSGTVFPPVVLPMSLESVSCSLTTPLQPRVFARIGAQLASYDYVLFAKQYVGPGTCDGAEAVGMGEPAPRIGPKYASINAAAAWNEQRFVRTAAHEMGHMLALHHSAYFPCMPGMNHLCNEFGDPFDLMGSGDTLSAVRKGKLGFLALGASQIATHTGDYLLRASDAPGSGGVRQLEITRPGWGFFYDLEIRNPSAPFAPWRPTDPVATGVSIRMTNGARTAFFAGPHPWADSVLLGARPVPIYYQNDAPLLPGERWISSDRHISITTLWAGFGWAGVHIDIRP